MKASAAIFGTLAVVCGFAGGCSSNPSADEASMGVLSYEPTVLTLGAGDALGWRVYTNDIILAARMNDAGSRRAIVTESAE